MKLATRIFKRNDWYVTSGFGKRKDPVTGELNKEHNGCDYGTNKQKWEQYALEDGIVTRVGYNATGFGNYLDIQYPRIGMQCFHAHLDKVNVKKGDKVNKDTCIGLTGTTGKSTGIHLHFGIKPIDGNYIDPEKYDYQPLQEQSLEEQLSKLAKQNLELENQVDKMEDDNLLLEQEKKMIEVDNYNLRQRLNFKSVIKFGNYEIIKRY